MMTGVQYIFLIFMNLQLLQIFIDLATIREDNSLALILTFELHAREKHRISSLVLFLGRGNDFMLWENW